VSDRVGDKIRIKSIRLVSYSHYYSWFPLGLLLQIMSFLGFCWFKILQAVSDGTPVAQDVVQLLIVPIFLLRLWIRLVVLNGCGFLL